jgi:hypothetical protein
MLIAEDKAQALEQVRAGLEVWIEEGGDLTELEQHAIKWRILPQFERMKADAEKLRAGKFSAEAQPREDIEEETQPRPEAQAGEVEDDTNPANNIRRKLWRMGQALKYIKAANVELPPERVGSAISWLSGPDQAAGRACFVGCFGEAEGGKLWAMGFPEIPGSVDDIYTVAQRLDWRYPIAVNLNRLDRMVEQTEAALMRAR